MNETMLFCILGIAGLGFCIFTDVEMIKTKMEHKALAIGRIVFCMAGILLLIFVLIGNKPEEDGMISASEIKGSEVYAHLYYNLYDETLEEYSEYNAHAKKNNFWEITENREKAAEILAGVEVVRPFEEGETIDYTKGDPFLLLQKKNIRYIFYLYDADQFISVHSEHRYHPLLWVERIEIKKNGTEICQGWHCTLTAADYAEIINLTYNYSGLLDYVEIPMGLEAITLDWRRMFDGESDLGPALDRDPVLIEAEPLDADILLDSKVMAFENSASWFYYGDNPAYCQIIEDEDVRSEIVRIMMSGKIYAPVTHFREQIKLGGDGQPSIVFFQEKDETRTEYIISFIDGARQLKEDYLFHDAPVVSITRSVYVKEKLYYNLEESEGYAYILSAEDYAWLYELKGS